MLARCGETKFVQVFPKLCKCLKFETFRNPPCNSSQERLHTVMCRVERSQRTNWMPSRASGRLSGRTRIRLLQKLRDQRSLLKAGPPCANINVAQLRSVRKQSRDFVIRTSGRWWWPRIFKRILQAEIV